MPQGVRVRVSPPAQNGKASSKDEAFFVFTRYTLLGGDEKFIQIEVRVSGSLSARTNGKASSKDAAFFVFTCYILLGGDEKFIPIEVRVSGSFSA